MKLLVFYFMPSAPCPVPGYHRKVWHAFEIFIFIKEIPSKFGQIRLIKLPENVIATSGPRAALPRDS